MNPLEKTLAIMTEAISKRVEEYKKLSDEADEETKNSLDPL